MSVDKFKWQEIGLELGPTQLPTWDALFWQVVKDSLKWGSSDSTRDVLCSSLEEESHRNCKDSDREPSMLI